MTLEFPTPRECPTPARSWLTGLRNFASRETPGRCDGIKLNRPEANTDAASALPVTVDSIVQWCLHGAVVRLLHLHREKGSEADPALHRQFG